MTSDHTALAGAGAGQSITAHCCWKALLSRPWRPPEWRQKPALRYLSWYFLKDHFTINGVRLPEDRKAGGKQVIALDSLEEMVVTGKDTETDFRHILE